MSVMTTLAQRDRLAAVDAVLPEIRSTARAYDEAAEFPASAFDALNSAGLLTLTVPQDHGGHGLWWDTNFTDYYEILSTIAAADGSVAQLLQVHSHAVGMLAWHASAAQRERYLKEVVEDGKLIASVGSEARVGSTAREEYKSELEETPSGLRLNCEKYFASLGPGADYYLVWVAHPGSGSYAERQLWVLVPRDAPEVELVNNWDPLGMRATVSWGIRVKDYAVPADAVIGEPGSWVREDPRSFTLGYAANHLGMAEGAYDLMSAWVRERSYLRSSEIVRAALGEMASDLFGARCALEHAARLWERAGSDGWRDKRQCGKAEHYSLRALHLARQLALDVTQRAFDICGARATMRDLPLERIYRDARTFSLHSREELSMIRVTDELLDDEYAGKAGTGGLALATRHRQVDEKAGATDLGRSR